MVAKKDYHLRRHEKGWMVTRLDVPGAGSVYATRSEALAAGREYARRDHVDLIIRREDGRITVAPMKMPFPTMPSSGIKNSRL
jgi:hypothetical protein